MRRIGIFTNRDQLEQVNKDTGQVIFCEDSAEMFIDTPNHDRVPVGLNGHTKTYNITLKKENWNTNDNNEIVQLPEYSEEIFRGKYYDEKINILITPSLENTESMTIIARVNNDGTRLEFVSDILPTTDIVMTAMTM